MQNIEVEIRSFVTKERYEELLEFFKKEGELVNEDYQETYYFDSKEDLRIQKNKFFAKIWMKKGEIHDDHREEIEIKFDKDKFNELEKLFLGLGYNVEIKWFRNRNAFKWKELDVAVDYTKGYGYILELEQMSTEEEKEKTLESLKQKMKELKVDITPKEDFNKKYEYYKDNWKELTSD